MQLITQDTLPTKMTFAQFAEMQANFRNHQASDLAAKCIRIDGLLVTVPPQASPTTTLATLTAPTTTTNTYTYCRISGRPLASAPTAFPIGQPVATLGLDPIFSLSWTTLGKIDQLNSKKTHDQASLLALAYIVHSQTFGSICAIKHPIQFTHSVLRANYGKIIFLAKTFANLPQKTRAKLLVDLPQFDTRKLVTSDTKSRHGMDYSESLAALPSYFINWIDTLTEELAFHLDTFTFLNLAEDAKAIATQLDIELGKEDRQARLRANLGDYWGYILLDTKEQFLLTEDWRKAMASQIRNPSDSSLLREFASYLGGLAAYSKSRGFTGLVPAIQYQNAQAQVIEWAREVEASSIDASLLVPKASKPKEESLINLLDLDDECEAGPLSSLSTLSPSSLTTSPSLESTVDTLETQAKPKPVNPAFAAMQAKLAALAKRAEDLEAHKQAVADAKVLALVNKLV